MTAATCAGPFYTCGEGRDLRLGLPIDTRHLNSRGGLHGGVVAALADLTLGRALASSTEPPLPLVTVSLKVDYVAGAAAGDWIEGHVRHVENRGLLHLGTGVDKTVALMTGIYRARRARDQERKAVVTRRRSGTSRFSTRN